MEAGDDTLRAVLDGVAAARDDLRARVAGAIVLLSARGEWAALVRLALDAGCVTSLDISRAAGVTASTVERWANGETEPQPVQVRHFMEAILGLLTPDGRIDAVREVRPLVA